MASSTPPPPPPLPPPPSYTLDVDEYDEPTPEPEAQQTPAGKRQRPSAEPQTAKRTKNDRRGLLASDKAGTSRTIYLGGLPPGLEHFEAHRQILDQVRGAPVEALRILPEKQCAFVDFYDEQGALRFAERFDGAAKRFLVRDKELKVAWASSSNCSANVQTAIRNGATRNIYFSGIEAEGEEGAEARREELRRACDRFGPIDTVKVVADKKIGFVHMCSVAAAMEAVDVLSARPEWRGKRISFGSDRCGDRPPPGVHPSMQASRRQHEHGGADEGGEQRPGERLPYRTVYLGGLPPGATAEELCDVIRGGLVQSIRLGPPDKHCAFVTFVDEPAAVLFHDFFAAYGFVVRGEALRLGWSKPSAVPHSVTQALQKGATRNVYIGNIELAALAGDPAAYLAADCAARFGPVESASALPGKNMAFVTFCNLLDAVKALAGLRELPEYRQCRLAYGKDRCAQLPRPPAQSLAPPAAYYPPAYGAYPPGYLPYGPPPYMLPGYHYPAYPAQDPQPHYPAGPPLPRDDIQGALQAISIKEAGRPAAQGERPVDAAP